MTGSKLRLLKTNVCTSAVGKMKTLLNRIFWVKFVLNQHRWAFNRLSDSGDICIFLANSSEYENLTFKSQIGTCVILQVTGNTYLKDNISRYIRMQNNQMIICEEISAPPVDLTDIFATRVYATTSTSVWFQSSPLCYNGWTPTSWDELAGKLVELFQRLLWLSFRMDQALISH